MSDWGEGYYTERDYAASFQKEMAPSHLRCLLALRRRRLFDLYRPFRYLDLGCGSGLTITALAAANPRSEFVGIDFSPDHILLARDFAEASELSNLRFIEASFKDLINDSTELGAFDFVGCHGVYTWVSADNQERIVELLRRHVAPGGLVYLGYNAMPGWAPVQPLRHLVNLLAERHPSAHSDRAIDEAAAILGELRDHNAGYMADNTPVQHWLDRMAKHQRSYLSHEYLPKAAKPLWHDEVAHDLSPARLRYVGSARLVENFDSINIPESLRARVADAETKGLGETVRDLVINQTFRIDVFARGAPPADETQSAAAFDDLPIALPDLPSDPPSIRTPHGEIPLAADVSRPVIECLAEKPMRIGDLVEQVCARGPDTRQARQVVVALLAGGIALPLADLEPSAEAVAACDRFNRTALNRAAKGMGFPCLASPQLGGGIAVRAAEQRALAGMASFHRSIKQSGERPLMAKTRRRCLHALGLNVEDHDVL